jgi:hypothetical protein
MGKPKKARLPKVLLRAYRNLYMKTRGNLKGMRRAARRDRRTVSAIAPSYKAWKKRPNRYDWRGIDLPGTYRRKKR